VIEQSNQKLVLSLSNEMEEVDITYKDLSVIFESNFDIDFEWTAKYSDSETLEISYDITSVLEGTETLTIKILNWKTIRAVNGG
jgi:hypothetical protein